MCTVTLVPRPCGFRLMCNRDEQDARLEALDPQRQTLRGREAVFPLDPHSDGTWIGVNDLGLAMTVLNRSPLPGGRPRRGSGLSRGMLIPMLLGYDSLSDAMRTAAWFDPSAFQPFRLVAVQRREVGIVTWDGTARSVEYLTISRPLLFTSSSLGDRLVEPPRLQLFEALVLQAKDSWLSGQIRFHQHQWPDRPELSVRMARTGASTVSRSVVDVIGDTVRLGYQPLSTAAQAA